MGVGENIKGTVKEKLGEALDDEDLRAEGDAQQRKGEQEAKETEDRARAKAHEEKARELDDRQQDLEER
jgi:uncharacterized protein YjbJ (UPF0337 family)